MRDSVMEQHLRVALRRIGEGDLRAAQRNIEYARSRMLALAGPIVADSGEDMPGEYHTPAQVAALVAAARREGMESAAGIGKGVVRVLEDAGNDDAAFGAGDVVDAIRAAATQEPRDAG